MTVVIIEAPREQPAPPPPLPTPKLFHLIKENCTIEYIELQQQQPTDATKDGAPSTAQVTIVLLHGAPSSYQDFHNIIPCLQQQLQNVNLRIIGVNLPGFGGSVPDPEQYFEQISALPSIKLTLQMLRELCTPEENVFLMGHSFGAHSVINLAVFNQEPRGGDDSSTAQTLNIKGMVLLAPVGCRPHHVVKPKTIAFIVRLLRSSNSVIAGIMPGINKFLYTKMLGFSGDFPASHYVAAIVRASTTDFSDIARHVEATKATTPTLLAWTKDDEYVEEEIPQELAELCNPSGPRIVFTDAGHFIQSTHPEYLACEVAKWVRQVLPPK